MFRQYREFEKGEFIVIGGDLSAGGKDRSCCQFISKNRLDVPLIYDSSQMAIEMTNDIVPVLENICDFTGVKPLIAYERNNGGVFEMERLATMNRNGSFDLFKMPVYGKDIDTEQRMKQEIKYGWDTNTATRPKMLADLKEAIDKKIIRIYDKATIEEMYSFIVSQTSNSWKAQAERNAKDDRVMALAIAWQVFLMSPSVKQARGHDYKGRKADDYDFNPMTV